MELVYSTRRHPFADGRRYKNPRHFFGPVEGAKKVYIEGDWPEVVEAYEKVGVKVAALGPKEPLAEKAAPKASAPKADEPKA